MFFVFDVFVVAEVIAQNAQYFVRQPANLTVVEKTSVLLECQIGHQHSPMQTQWIRHGIALGKAYLLFCR